MDIYDIFFTFTFFSIAGWVLEVAYRSVIKGRFVNPGLLSGPFLILYGCGALLLAMAASGMRSWGLGFRIIVYFVLTTGLELASGIFAERVFNVRLWDYSDQKFNFKGRVCLLFSFYWVMLALAFEKVILPGFTLVLNGLSPVFKGVFATSIIAAMVVDFTLLVWGRLFSVPETGKEILNLQFEKAIGDLLLLSDVKRLAHFPHHRGKTRLDHVKEVAFLSFVAAQKLSLDAVAVARGAILHDLFFYDWLHEGPRLHGLRHHKIALANARRLVRLSDKEADIIEKHMWPLTLVPPKYLESLLVCIVDTFCSIRDYVKKDY